MKIYAFALAALTAMPASGQTDDYASHLFTSRLGSLYGRGIGKNVPTGQVEFTPKPEPKQATAKGISPVGEGAIVCPSLDDVSWLLREIGRARVARTYMPREAREMTKLKDGYDPWAEPSPSEYRCQIVPNGTPLNVKWQGGIPVVWGTMQDGRPFAGVTSPVMIDR